MAANALKKINTEAKRIAKKTGKSWKMAHKQAVINYRQGKISGVKKKSSRGTAKKSGKRSSSKARIGAVMGTVPGAKKVLKEKLGWLLATQRTAATKREKKALQPRINALTRSIKALP